MGEETNNTQGKWEQICNKTSATRGDSRPPVWTAVVVELLPSGVRLTPARSLWIGLLVWFSFTASILWVILYIATFRSVILSTAIIIMLTPFIVSLLYKKLNFIKRISWHSLGEELAVEYGSLFRTDVFTIPRAKLQCGLSLVCDHNKPVTFDASDTILFLTRGDKPNTELVIAYASDRSWLTPAFEKISQFLKGQAADQTLVELKTPSGDSVKIAKSCLSESSITDSGELYLSSTSSNSAIFTRRKKEIFCAIGLLSIGVIIAGIPIVFRDSMYDQFGEKRTLNTIYFCAAVATFFAGLGIHGLSRWLFQWSVIADLRHDCLDVRPIVGFLGQSKTLCRLSDIIAIQLCTEIGFEVRCDDLVKTAFRELNVVLKDPLGKRINLLKSSRSGEVHDHAQRFANFLGVQLLDHT